MAIDLAKLRALAEAATPGPWSWFGNTKTNSIMLATIDRGRQYVMRFRRWGMGGAQPVFLKPDERGGGWMHPAKDLVVYEVDYRKDFHDIDNADARWIAAADPTTVLALIAEIERLTALVPVEIPPPSEPDGWGWYVPDRVPLVSPFPTREAAIEDAIREGHTNELHVGEMHALDLANFLTADDLRERIEESVWDDLGLEDFHVGMDHEADRALEQWVRRYLEPDGSTYCEGAEVTAEEIALVRAAIGGAA